MDKKKLNFIEETEQIVEGFGMTRSLLNMKPGWPRYFSLPGDEVGENV